MPESIIYTLTASGMLAASYLLGHLMLLLGGGENEDHAFAGAFRRLSLGLLLIVTVYAAVNCAGATVLAGVLPLMLFGVRFRRPRWRRIKVDPAAATLFCGAVVLIAALIYFSGHDLAGNIYSLHYDHSFYAALANYVDRSGIESTNIELMFPAMQSPAIYHWFDIHLSALAGHITGNYYNARLFITIPALAGLALLGLAALIEKYCARAGAKTPWLACLVFLISYNFGSYPFHDAPESVYMMICVVAWVMLSKNKTLPLVIGGLLVSSAAPALFTGAAVALAFGLAKGRRSGAYWKNAAVLVLGGLWCAAFYTLTVRENPYFIHYMPITQQIRQAFSEFSLPAAKEHALSFSWIIVSNFAICALFFVLLGKDNKRSVVRLLRENSMLFFAILTGSLFAFLFWFVRDGLQLATVVCMPIAFAGQVILPAMLFTGRGRIAAKIAGAAIIAAGVAVIWFLGNTYRGQLLDKEFIQKVAAAEGPVVWVDTPERRETDNAYARDANYVVPFSAVRRLRNDYFPIRLDVYDIVYDPEDMRDYAVLASIENSTFYRWVESQNIPMKELRQAQTRFIKENGIHYVIAPTDDMWIHGRGFTIEERTNLKSRGYTLYRISYDENPVQ